MAWPLTSIQQRFYDAAVSFARSHAENGGCPKAREVFLLAHAAVVNEQVIADQVEARRNPGVAA